MAADTQVLVVGAGPVGVFMAGELRRHGVSCRVIDRNHGPQTAARASVVQARTLEILESLGIVDGFLAEGIACRDVIITTPDLKQLRAITLDELDSPFAFSLSIEQSRTERLLVAYLESLGGAVERRVELRTFSQDETGVSAVLAHADGPEETIRCAYLVACDGAHSSVRHALGVAFTGEAKPRLFVVAEARIDWHAPIPRDHLHFFVCDEGQVFCGPFAGGRWLFSANVAERPTHPDDEPSLAELEAILGARSPGATLSDVSWKSYFRVNLRQAERYSVGRVFLAGDAAHVQSPAGGQGMNTGIQDAYNLGWKLGLVLGGHAPARLLESYHPERHRAGKDMLVLNDYLYHVELENEVDFPVPEELKRHLAVILAGQEVVRERLRRAIAELNINYRHSPIVARHRLLPTSPGTHVDAEAYHDFGAAPHAGDRPADARIERHPSGEATRLGRVWAGTKHHLLLFAGRRTSDETLARLRALRDEVAAAHGRTVETHIVVPREVPETLRSERALLVDAREEVHRRYGASVDCLYLIRPDGYVGFRSQPVDAEALRSYLTKVLVA